MEGHQCGANGTGLQEVCQGMDLGLTGSIRVFFLFFLILI